MAEYPREFSVETSPQPTQYTLAGDYYAVSEADADKYQVGVDVEFHLEEGNLTVCRKRHGEPMPASATRRIGPVYRLGEHGPLAVPTGKVFVRFAEQTSLADHRGEIERAGFEISQTLSYAPHAGWVEPGSREIAEAVSRFQELGQIPGVEAVEPQMLMERRSR